MYRLRTAALSVAVLGLSAAGAPVVTIMLGCTVTSDHTHFATADAFREFNELIDLHLVQHLKNHNGVRLLVEVVTLDLNSTPRNDVAADLGPSRLIVHRLAVSALRAMAAGQSPHPRRGHNFPVATAVVMITARLQTQSLHVAIQRFAHSFLFVTIDIDTIFTARNSPWRAGARHRRRWWRRKY
jgi:hypothetical protein